MYLFILSHADYLRHYGAVIAALEARGAAVTLAFTAPGSHDLDVARALLGPGVRVAVAPRPAGWWWPVADTFRAVRDYDHYLNPAFDGAPRLVERASARVPRSARRLVGDRGTSQRRRRFFERRLDAVERTLPADPAIVGWLRNLAPSAVLISPLVEFSYDQVHFLKAARSLAIPTGHLVASWDNLSNKGRIQISADRVLVWNDIQREEAIALHDLPADRVVVTGAQLYDPWFAPALPASRAAFCAGLGFDPARPVLLYAGSSPFIGGHEVAFAVSWIERIRASADAELAAAQILIRPHPHNAAQWQGLDLARLPDVALQVPGNAPGSAAAQRDYFASLSHAAAVVGINTSVFVEAAIVGRRCLAVRTPQFDGSQLGTLHFHHLVRGGVVTLAPDFDHHLADLGEAIRNDPVNGVELSNFVRSFVRPRGIDRAVVPIVVDAIEQVATLTAAPSRVPWAAPLVRAAIAPIAFAYLRPRYLARVAARPPAGPPEG